MGVTLGVAVGVDVAVDVAIGVAVAVAVGVGVGVGVGLQGHPTNCSFGRDRNAVVCLPAGGYNAGVTHR